MGVRGSEGLHGRKRGRVVTGRENEWNEGRREERLKGREGRRSLRLQTEELQSRRKTLQTNSDVRLTPPQHIQLVPGMLEWSCSDFPPQRVSENDCVNKDFCPDLINSPSVTAEVCAELQVGVFCRELTFRERDADLRGYLSARSCYLQLGLKQFSNNPTRQMVRPIWEGTAQNCWEKGRCFQKPLGR